MPTLSIIGTLFDVAEDGMVRQLPGYHVNSTAELPELAAQLVTPSTPRLMFDGVPTWCYVFDDERQANELLATVNLAEPQRPPVRSIPRRQGRLWLHREGLLDQVEALVAAADVETRIWWFDSNEFHIDNPVLRAVWLRIGLSLDQLPAAFEAASTL